MKVDDFEILKVINNILGNFNFATAYKVLEVISYPEMPDKDIEELKTEAGNLLYSMLNETYDDTVSSHYKYSYNFKALYVNGELHLSLDMGLDFRYIDSGKLKKVIEGK